MRDSTTPNDAARTTSRQENVAVSRWPVNVWRFLVLGLALVVMVAGNPFSGTAGSQSSTPTAEDDLPAVTREVLVSADPELSPGNLLELVRYTIQPGTVLAPHTHPGTQIAFIESGVLQYVVVAGGEIAVTRASGLGTPGPVEYLGPGDQTDLYPGDSVVETSGVIHYGANPGDDPVVILASTLLVTDLPAAILAATPVPDA